VSKRIHRLVIDETCVSTAAKKNAAKEFALRGPNKSRAPELLIFAALALITFILFAPVRHHEFINYDDPDYIIANPIVQRGVTWEGIHWAFTSSHSYNWHPITWISHMSDVQFFGLNPGAHHLVSLFFHIANALLLFWLLRKTTNAIWPSALVAAVFAWHPLHVESVAWACERKDVLSTLFWLLTTIFYVRFVNAFKVHNLRFKVEYALALVCFALGLMSKPMLVTLPFVLLLLDFWPLGRAPVFSVQCSVFSRARPKSEYRTVNRDGALGQTRPTTRLLLLEKIPFFALTAASSVITFLVQRKEGAVVNFEQLPLDARLANAIVSYVRYIGKTVWPTDLIIYNQPMSWSALQVTLAVVLILLFSAGAIFLARKQPFIFVGWFWFIGTLVPVIGIVQVGAQAIADRYMYVPMIGLSIAIIWPLAEATRRSRFSKIALCGIAGVALTAFFFISSKQIRYWRNSETVFAHAVSVDPNNVVARVMLANSLLEQQQFNKAEEHFKAALALNPNFPEVHFNLGNLFMHQQKTAEAIAEYESALRKNPDYAEAHANLAVALGMQNRLVEAIAHYEKSLALQPQQPDLLRNLALDLMNLRRFDEATARLQRALELDSSDAMACFLLGNAHLAQRNPGEAAKWYSRAVELKPDFAEARERLREIHSGNLR
jgi:protein O-mannosyl-transferase